jgi:hypothetical protein
VGDAAVDTNDAVTTSNAAVNHFVFMLLTSRWMSAVGSRSDARVSTAYERRTHES